jgi:hypothetical protein
MHAIAYPHTLCLPFASAQGWTQGRQGNPLHERVAPKIGEPFDFTDEEVEDIRASDPTSLREPINEGGSKEEREAEEAVRGRRKRPRKIVEHR